MTVPLTASALVLALTTSSWADLSWEYIEKRQKKQREVISQAKKDITKVDQAQSPEAVAAYQKLGQALNSHPEMTAVNTAEANARLNLQKARESGEATQIASAQQAVSRAAMDRFRKAASIPKLAKLITAWQEAASGGVETTNTPQTGKNLEQIEVGLDDLFE